jgi:hypothetical protein
LWHNSIKTYFVAQFNGDWQCGTIQWELSVWTNSMKTAGEAQFNEDCLCGTIQWKLPVGHNSMKTACVAQFNEKCRCGPIQWKSSYSLPSKGWSFFQLSLRSLNPSLANIENGKLKWKHSNWDIWFRLKKNTDKITSPVGWKINIELQILWVLILKWCNHT